MRPIRTGLLLLAAAAMLLPGPALIAQVAPNVTGETGLFELSTADMLPTGRFSFSLFYNQSAMMAGPSLLGIQSPDDPLRYNQGKLGVTAAYGLTKNWEASLNFGQKYWWSEERAWTGNINSYPVNGSVRHNESDKVRLGTKILLNPKDPVKVAALAGWSIATQSRGSAGALQTYRADFDFGLSFNYGIFTAQTGYFLAGDTSDADLPNQFFVGAGVGIPIVPNVLKVIAELNRVHYDGGQFAPPDYSNVTLGGRVGLGPMVLSAGARANIDRWVKYGTSPNNFGVIAQVSFAPQPAAEATPKVAAAPGPDSAPAASLAAAPAPAPVPGPAKAPNGQDGPRAAPAPPKAATTTTDEILYDPAKSRLTNIAKAILDGVALRLKNNVSASCTVSGWADPKEKGDRAALATARAEAAKDYLVKRHGIDSGRISTTARTDSEPGPDATRNRRAVVTVTFP